MSSEELLLHVELQPNAPDFQKFIKNRTNLIYNKNENELWARHIICGKEHRVKDNGELECDCEPMTTEQMKNKIYEATDGEYYMYGEYTAPNEKITIIHNKCGGTFDTTANDFFLKLAKCPDCAMSKGEYMVRSWLIENNIAHVKQYRFPDCRSIKNRTLPFDFYLPTLEIAIEFDGVQHFKPVKRFGGEAAFKYRVECDDIKNNYCLNNNIKLIRLTDASDMDKELGCILDKIEEKRLMLVS